MENGLATIRPPPLEPKTIVTFQEGNGKGETNVSVVETQEVIIEMHDMGKWIGKQKHGWKSKGKGVDVMVTTKANVKTRAWSPSDDYELTSVAKKGKKKAKVVEHQIMQKGNLKVKDITIIHSSSRHIVGCLWYISY